MGRKSENFLILDCETGGSLDNPIIYDIGWVIINRKGERLDEFHSCVKEVITNPDLMMKAFYARKIFSIYLPSIASGDMQINEWDFIRSCLSHDIDRYNVKTLCAYNAKFDFRAMKATNNQLGYDKFFDKPIRILCLWQSACELIMNNRNYRHTAQSLGWLTDKGNFKTNAEVAFRYIQNDFDFVEEHTALEDARIESVLLAHMLEQKKALPYNFSGFTWQEVNKND